MGRKDDIKKALVGHRARLLAERLEPLPAAEKWTTLRDEVIHPDLVNAQDALRETGIGADAQRTNGGSGVMLLVGPRNAPNYRHITFTFIAAAQPENVQITSTEDGLGEGWDIWYVTAANVSEKVDRFIEKIAARYFG